MFELINPYIAKILVSAKNGDSIRCISKKIQESYGWTYKWILELENIGAIFRKKQEVHINKNNRFYRYAAKFVKDSISSNLSLTDAYLLPNLAGLEYIFTNIDAVFIWTKGGYNIGRSKNS
ncbi:helix-turn-helix domain-containing protein, partial [Candidatus Woesearchaeota archaeon]|nr:helix-turn-helix domain-containing protein [Candidatus Woesearchaeota archaeon]